MSTDSVPVQHLSRGWRPVIFAPAGDGQRRRRGSDGVRFRVLRIAMFMAVAAVKVPQVAT